MSKARGLADLGNVYNDGALSNRNLIINGAMQVAQRGTSLTGIGVSAGGPFICDRFSHTQGSTGGSGVTTMEQSTDAPDGFASSLKLTVTTADTLSGSENLAIRTRLEGQNVQMLKYGTAAAESVTISFWVKASEAGTYSLELFSTATRSALKGFTVDTSGTWEYKTLTFSGDTGAVIPNDNASGYSLIWMLDSGPDDLTAAYDFTTDSGFKAVTGQVNFMATISNYFQITGVQLEVGDTATPFEHRSIGQELALCQRYYHSHFRGVGKYTSTTNATIADSFPVTMRATPTVTLIAGTQILEMGVANRNATAVPSSSLSKEGGYINVTTLAATAGNVCAADTSVANFDAEL